MSFGAKKTIQMIEKACGYEVTPLDLSLITSTDDTSLYITDDTIQKMNYNEWHILSKEGVAIKNFRNSKHVGKKKDANHGGFRVKMCFSLSASGQIADLCVVIGGLTSDELPMSENELRASRGIRIIEESGLTPGCTLNPQSKEYGYLILCRGSIAGVDTARHEWYDKNVFFRFIKNLKEEKIEVTNEEVPRFFTNQCLAYVLYQKNMG